MQIKTFEIQLRTYQNDKSGTLTSTHSGGDVEQQELIHCGQECKMAPLIWKTIWQFLTRVNIPLPYNAVITSAQNSPHTNVYRSFTYNYQNWKQSRCPSVGECINKLWCIQTMKYYTVLKTNELPSTGKTWRTHICILLSGRRNLKSLHTIQFHKTLRKRETMETVKISVAARGWECTG